MTEKKGLTVSLGAVMHAPGKPYVDTYQISIFEALVSNIEIRFFLWRDCTWKIRIPNIRKDQVVEAYLTMIPDKNEEKDVLHFLFDSSEEVLLRPGVFVAISALAQSPFLHAHGSRELVSFLASLPYPSAILVGDSLQQHSIMAVKGRDKRKLSIEEARRIAVERGDLYVEAIDNAIKENKNVTGTNNIALVRWDGIYDENKRSQEAILQRHYLRNSIFRERVDMVAMEFLNQRTPNSRYMSQRKAHSVNYILCEMAIFITGIRFKGKRYNTLAYATTPMTWTKTKANLASTIWTLFYDILTKPMFQNLREEVVEAGGGIVAQHGWPILSIS